MNYKIKKSNLFILIFIVGLILFVLLRKDFAQIIAHLGNINIAWTSLGVVCIAVYWIIEARTLHLILNAYDKEFSYWKVLKLVITTQFFNGVTPFSSGGQPFQILILSKNSKLKVSNITSAIIHNFILYQVMLVFMGLVAIILENVFQLFPIDTVNLKWLSLIGFGLNFLIILVLIIIAVSSKLTGKMLRFVYFLIHWSPFRKRLSNIREKIELTVHDFHNDILLLMQDRKMYVRVLILNFVKLLSYYMIAYFICRAVGLHSISVIQAVIASAYVMLITSVVPLPGGSGGAELGFLIFFAAFVSGPHATAIMILWRIITYYLGMAIGLMTLNFGYSSEQKSETTA